MCYNAIHCNTLQHIATHYMLHWNLRTKGRLLIPESNPHVIYHMRACYQELAIWNTNTGRKELESDSKKPKSHSILCKKFKTLVDWCCWTCAQWQLILSISKTNNYRGRQGQCMQPTLFATCCLAQLECSQNHPSREFQARILWGIQTNQNMPHHQWLKFGVLNADTCPCE